MFTRLLISYIARAPVLCFGLRSLYSIEVSRACQYKRDKVMTEIRLIAEQCRGARAMLGWSQADLAKEAKVAKQTLADFERGARNPYDRTLADIRAALESSGVIFIDGAEPGVKLRRRE